MSKRTTRAQVAQQTLTILEEGAYLHPSQRCLEQAQHRRAFPRALRVPGPLGGQRLAGYLRSGGAAEDGKRLPKAGQDSDERPMSTRR